MPAETNGITACLALSTSIVLKKSAGLPSASASSAPERAEDRTLTSLSADSLSERSLLNVLIRCRAVLADRSLPCAPLLSRDRSADVRVRYFDWREDQILPDVCLSKHAAVFLAGTAIPVCFGSGCGRWADIHSWAARVLETEKATSPTTYC